MEVNMMEARKLEEAVKACGGWIEHKSDIPPHSVKFGE